jgi:hypothetical protein
MSLSLKKGVFAIENFIWLHRTGTTVNYRSSWFHYILLNESAVQSGVGKAGGNRDIDESRRTMKTRARLTILLLTLLMFVNPNTYVCLGCSVCIQRTCTSIPWSLSSSSHISPISFPSGCIPYLAFRPTPPLIDTLKCEHIISVIVCGLKSEKERKMNGG